MNRSIATRPLRRGALRFAAAAACLGAFFGWTPPMSAMSADSSSYAVVLPWVMDTGGFRSRIAVENHSTSTLMLNAFFVGDDLSAMPGLHPCSDASANSVPQTFAFAVKADGVLEFDLGALLAEKCKAPVPAGPMGNRGTLTILTPPNAPQALISASARVERIPAPGVTTLGYSQHGIPLGALEGSKLLMAGLRSGVFPSGAKDRVDCLFSSFADATRSGDLYTLRVKDSRGSVLGAKVFALSPWSSKIVNDVVATVGAAGDYDGLQVEIEPGANPTSPSMIASCRTIDLSNPSVTSATSLSVGKVYEPKDMQLQRSVTVDQTPGWGKFRFNPQAGKALHVAFLRAPDMVTCQVDDPQLILIVEDPSRRFVAGGFQSTGEFFTGSRSDVSFGTAGGWGLTVKPNPANPPSGSINYEITCVSGNGISQIDRILP
jgi:hypothetical protein